jgi:tetratricopeptide (TPR) repeat protein
MVQGRLEEIEPALPGILARNPNGLTRAVAAHLYCELGRLEQAEALLARDAANDFADIPYEVAWLTAMTGYARVAAETRSARAAQYLYDRLAPWRAHIDCPGNTVNGSVARYLGLLAAALGRLDAAETHFNEALRAHERIQAPYWIATTRLEKAQMLLERAQPNDQQQARLALQDALGVARLMGFASIARRAADLLPRAS